MNYMDDLLPALEKILTLENGWGDEPSTKKFSRSSIKKIDEIIKKIIGIVKFDPVIAPMIDNSIDAHWKNTNVQLLVNIPEDSDKISIYGRRFDRKNEIMYSGNDIDVIVSLIKKIVS
jgi:hypothetical protein